MKPGETVVFSWVVFKSRAHRDRVNAKVMKEMEKKGDMPEMPFDMKRMVYGGFKVLVDEQVKLDLLFCISLFIHSHADRLA